MSADDLVRRVDALERYLDRRGWAVVRRLERARIYEQASEGRRLLVADPDTQDAGFHLERAYELLARWEQRPRALINADIDGHGRPGRLEMFFDGEPVNQGQIELKFASNMLGDARKLIAAAHHSRTRSGPLSNLGTLTTPQRVMLASTPVGSFGFELVEEPEEPAALPFAERTHLAQAMDEVVGLFESVHREEDIGGLLVEQDPRVLAKLRDMLHHIRSAGASVRFVSPTRNVSLSRHDIEQARERLAEGEKSVRKIDYEGRLEGILPVDRVFELRVDSRLTEAGVDPLPSEELIKGAVARSVEDALVRAWSASSQERVRARIREVQTPVLGREPKTARALLAVWRPDEAPPPEDDSPGAESRDELVD